MSEKTKSGSLGSTYQPGGQLDSTNRLMRDTASICAPDMCISYDMAFGDNFKKIQPFVHYNFLRRNFYSICSQELQKAPDISCFRDFNF